MSSFGCLHEYPRGRQSIGGFYLRQNNFIAIMTMPSFGCLHENPGGRRSISVFYLRQNNFIAIITMSSFGYNIFNYSMFC